MKAYLVESRFGTLEGHIPKEEIIVIFEANRGTEVVVVRCVYRNRKDRVKSGSVF